MTIPKGLLLLLLLLGSITGFASDHATGKLHIRHSKSFYADSNTIVIPFEFKQSAIYHANTLEVVDSIIAILLKNKDIRITINGYAHVDEGRDSICYYLSLNRALFVRDYVVGRGVDSSRIKEVIAYGNTRPLYRGTNKQGNILNCRAEIKMNYPEPPKKPGFKDSDEDGVPDNEDKCPNIFGYKENGGCPDTNTIRVLFPVQQSFLSTEAYQLLDSVISILKLHPTYTISIQGNASKEEGIPEVCESLGKERAELVKGYLLSHYIGAARITSFKNMGTSRPVAAGKNPMEISLNARAEIVVIKNETK